nr:hypothetical protein Iba_chr14fCG2950 [Ipomoea batatas]
MLRNRESRTVSKFSQHPIFSAFTTTRLTVTPSEGVSSTIHNAGLECPGEVLSCGSLVEFALTLFSELLSLVGSPKTPVRLLSCRALRLLETESLQGKVLSPQKWVHQTLLFNSAAIGRKQNFFCRWEHWPAEKLVCSQEARIADLERRAELHKGPGSVIFIHCRKEMILAFVEAA